MRPPYTSDRADIGGVGEPLTEQLSTLFPRAVDVDGVGPMTSRTPGSLPGSVRRTLAYSVCTVSFELKLPRYRGKTGGTDRSGPARGPSARTARRIGRGHGGDSCPCGTCHQQRHGGTDEGLSHNQPVTAGAVRGQPKAFRQVDREASIAFPSARPTWSLTSSPGSASILTGARGLKCWAASRRTPTSRHDATTRCSICGQSGDHNEGGPSQPFVFLPDLS